MADEQIIYLSPEEELTNVRERLEQSQARHIILVIPLQTQLRSHVGWRLLHARMREVSKDVLVISSDRQVRAVAKAAGFRVADSQESPTTNRSRPGSRPGRSSAGGKMLPRARSAPAKGATDNRTQRQREQPARRHFTANESPLRQAPARDVESKVSRADEASTGKGDEPTSSTFESRDGGQRYGSTYDFHIDTSPSIRPLVPGHEEEEFPDPLFDQYNQAQFIRQRYQTGDPDAMLPPPEAQERIEELPPSYGMMPTPQAQGASEDPFAYLDDMHPVSLPEQHGSAPVEEIDAGVPDLADLPTDILDGEIEDLGDEGDITEQARAMRHPWDEPVPEEPPVPEAPRVYGMRPRNSRSGNLPPRPPVEDIDDEDMLAPISDRPTLVPPSAPARPPWSAAASTAGNRGPQPIIPPQPGPRQPGPRQPQARTGPIKPPSKAVKQTAKGSRSVVLPPTRQQGPAARSAPATQRKNSRITLLVFLGVILLFLILIGLLYFGPTADVTITVPSQAHTLKGLQFTTNPLDKAHTTVHSQVLTYDKSVSGPGTATGAGKVGNAQAAGMVTFTNKTSKSLDIPTGTVVSTSSGILFATTANALIPIQGSGDPNPPVPVQAQSSGDSGNVPMNSITSIPASSISQIEQANNGIPISSNTFSVTNPQPTGGGGAANATSVSQNDIQAEKANLNKQLQAESKAWLAQLMHRGDFLGTPVQTETVSTTPPQGQVVDNGKFSETVRLHLSVLVVQPPDLQAAAGKQLNAAALKLKPASVLVQQDPLTFSKIKSTPSKDGKSLSITLNATGQIIPLISTQNISQALVGKSVGEVKSDISNVATGLQGVKYNATIQVFPGFLTIMPFRPEHIHVIIQPVPAKTPSR